MYDAFTVNLATCLPISMSQERILGLLEYGKTKTTLAATDYPQSLYKSTQMRPCKTNITEDGCSIVTGT